MKHYCIYLAIAVLVLASLACQAMTGSPDVPPAAESTDPGVTEPTPVGDNNSNTDSVTSTDFPMTADAYNITDVNGTLLFYTKLSLEDTMKFYRDEYTARGFTEREILTVAADGTFSMVFDGDSSGKAVVIQSVDLGDGSRTVSIRLEDV
jgi:hypothetical protein